MGLLLWGAGTLSVVAMLMLNHVVAMPSPSDYDRLHQTLSRMQKRQQVPLLLHVIYEDCSCTEALFRHLLARGAGPGLQERVLFVGTSEARAGATRAAGFEFVRVGRDQLVNELGVEAAPLLLVLIDGELAYAGGYYRTPATVNPQDQPLLRRLLAGEAPDPLPLYGCAVSPELQQAVDPLGLKY